jgi:hypothetical protein
MIYRISMSYVTFVFLFEFCIISIHSKMLAMRVFPDVIILMCYWHVLDNIRKNKHLVSSDDVYEEIKHTFTQCKWH